MQIKFSKFIMNPRNKSQLFIFILLISCTTTVKNEKIETEVNDDYFTKIHKTRCEVSSEVINYQIGDLPCLKKVIQINSKEKIKIRFKITNKYSDDPYEYGYQELLRYKGKKIIERIKLRSDDDAYWSQVPFVRIRKQNYLADLDDDGFLEFAVFPFHPGSAIWGRVRIYSLKEKIEYWGEGKYQFEGDTFVQLNCMKCSKFDPEACKKCE